MTSPTQSLYIQVRKLDRYHSALGPHAQLL